MNPSDVSSIFGNLMEHFQFSNCYCRFELVPCPTDWVWNWLHCVFFCQFCDVTKVTMIHRKDFAKFGYKLNMKIFYEKILLYFLLSTSTMNRNLTSFLKFWLNSGSWKSQKALEISTFNFQHSILDIPITPWATLFLNKNSLRWSSPFLDNFLPDFVDCLLLVFVSTCVLICLVLLMDGFSCLIFIYRVFLLF